MREIRINEQHEGLMSSANGGYLSGFLAKTIGSQQATTTNLRRPVPIGEPTYLAAEADWAAIRLCDETLAEIRPAAGPVAEAGFVTIEEALLAREPEFSLDWFANCFVCGRGAPSGLGIEPRSLDDGRFVAIWRPWESSLIASDTVPSEYLHAALDCPGGFAALTAAQQPAVTGSMTVRVDFLPPSDQTLIVVGAAGSRDGRKLEAISTIYAENDEVVATAEAVWVTIDSLPVDRAA